MVASIFFPRPLRRRSPQPETFEQKQLRGQLQARTEVQRLRAMPAQDRLAERTKRLVNADQFSHPGPWQSWEPDGGGGDHGTPA